MNDDEFRTLGDRLHTKARALGKRRLLGPRMLAVAGALIVKHLPYELRVHILTTVTFLVAYHEDATEDDAAETLALIYDFLLPEASQGWPDVLRNDPLVLKALEAARRNLEHTKRALERARQESKKNMS